jgi:hypothetical protein
MQVGSLHQPPELDLSDGKAAGTKSFPAAAKSFPSPATLFQPITISFQLS